MKHIIKKHWRGLVVVFLGIGIFFVYAWFGWATVREGEPYTFNSPDETLNYFWTNQYAQGKPLNYSEPLEEVGNNLIRPRSVAVINNRVGPGSFIGMYVLYGGSAQLFNISPQVLERVIIFFTPIIAIIGVVFFYLLISLFFDKNVALLSALLAYIFPGWVYYASRGMYHNVLFVSLLITGLYLLTRALSVHHEQHKKKWWELYLYALSGIVLGMAIITRTSEIGWVVFIVLLIFLFHWKLFFKKRKHTTLHWFGAVLFVLFLVCMFIPVFTTNYALYGSPLSLGYSTGFSGEFSDLLGQRGLLFRLLISPFGFDIKSIAFNAYHYLVLFFPYYSISAGIGLLLWVLTKQKTEHKKRQLMYMLVWLIASAYLLVFYGSWQVSDRIDEGMVSLGTSYVRYWLPIYLGALPFMAYAMHWLVRSVIRGRLQPVVFVVLLAYVALWSVPIVFSKTDESLAIVKNNVLEARSKALVARDMIPDSSIVILGFKQADKIVFPVHKRLITELVVPRDYEAVAALAEHTDLYYYHFAPQETVNYISRRDFEPVGLYITDGQKLYGNEWLYKIAQKVEE